MIKATSNRFRIGFIFALLLIVGASLIPTLVSASFNANNLMDDGIFDNANTMTAAQIDAFLNTFPSSCISTNHGFSAPDPTGYNHTQGFLYGGWVSAGRVIYDAAQAYGLNPKVLLTTLQKEESLVDGSAGCSTLRYTSAVGYGCPDTIDPSTGQPYLYNWSGVNLYAINGTPVTSVNGTCVDTSLKAGFTQQIIRATWVFKYAEQRSEGNVGWAVIKGTWDNSDDPQSCYSGPMTQGTWAICPSGSSTYYDGYTTIDGTAVHKDNGATAALYRYTPHFSGNQSFDSIFLKWFGGIYADPYATGYAGQSAYPQLNPGQQASVYIEYQNLGTSTWYDDTSLSGAPAGTYPVHLATSHTLNRSSAFALGWPSASRPALNFAAVYLSDGTTLTTNQHVVAPGQIVKFAFLVSDSSNLSSGAYREYFMPVAEGSGTGLFNDPGTSLVVTINPSPSVAWRSQSVHPTIAPSDKQNVFITFINTGNVPAYDDQSIIGAPAGSYPTHLAISCPINSNSDFVSNWPYPNRPAVNFTAVYESDGTTLASNQHLAQPGQIVKFAFNLSVPIGYAANTYQVCFQPVLEGTGDGYYPNLGVYLNITVPSVSVISYSAAATSTFTMVSGEQKTLTFQVQNVGNLSLASGATVVTSNGTSYQNSSWSSQTIITTIPTSITPSGSVILNLTLLAPITSTNRNDNFTIQINDLNSNAVHDSSVIIQTQLAAPVYLASYVNESAFPVFTYGQTQNVFFSYKNISNKPWYDDIGAAASTITRSPLPTHLATTMQINRGSGFAYYWPSINRPNLNFSAVYESDGVTLAANQHVAQLGQIVKFGFTMAAASWVNPGVYREYFQPIIEGTSDGSINFQGTYLDVTLSTPRYGATYYSQSQYPTISKGQSSPAFIMYRNTGSAPWYDDTSYGSGPGNARLYPVHLATLNPINRSSDFGSLWPSLSRPSLGFTNVYESDGVTLAADQHVAQPNQIVKFAFSISLSSQSTITTGVYRECFGPVAEGSGTGLFNNPQTYLDVTVQ